MAGLFTPLLRKVYAAFGLFVLIYCLVLFFQHTGFYKERLYQQLISGSEQERASAAFDLAYLHGEAQLVRALKSRSPAVRIAAMNSLWDLWARAGGNRAYHRVQAAGRAVQRKSYPEALAILTQVTKEYPTFSEGWNRRATLLWEMGRFEEAIADAKRVVAINPNHFGAWQGMGLCHARLGDLEEASRCIRTALRIAPHDEGLRKLLGRCEEVLQMLQRGNKVPYDMI